MGYASKDIRNILVAGHAGCGKTTLTEALLYMSGATERMGRVEDGTTASDFDPEEIRRKALSHRPCRATSLTEGGKKIATKKRSAFPGAPLLL